MARYIDADLLISEIDGLKKSPWYNDNYDEHKCARQEAVNIVVDLCIKRTPTADVQEIRHGKWKEVYRNDIATVYECTNCKHLTFGVSDYCICGAKMDGKEDE